MSATLAGGRRSDRRALAAVLLAGAILVLLAVGGSDRVSHIDELQHFDYLEKITRGELVRRGDRVGEVAMREEACRGIDVGPRTYRTIYGQEKDLPRCGESRLDPERFPERGFNTAYIHPPTYYAITGALARAIRAVTPIGSLLTAGRVVGVLWLWAGLILVWRLLSSFAVPLAPRTIITLLCASAPAVLGIHATVNPDATAIAAGAAVLLATVAWERRAVLAWVPMAAAAASIAMKATNVIGVGLAVVYLILRAVSAYRSGDRARAKRCLALPVLLAVASLAAGAAWLAVSGRIAAEPADSVYQLQRFHVDTLSARDVVGQAGSGIFVVQSMRAPPFPQSGATGVAKAVLNTALLVSCAAAIAFARGGSRTHSLAGATLLALVAAGPLFVVSNVAFSGIFVEIPARYAISAVAGLFVVAALPLRSAHARRVGVALVVLQVGAFLQALIFS